MTRPFEIAGQHYRRIEVATMLPGYARLPVSLKVLAENVARHAPEALGAFTDWLAGKDGSEIPFHPSRVLMHDTTCLPALADLAAMRDAMQARGGDPAKVNPLIPVTLVIDHSVAVDNFGTKDAAERNLAADFARNGERYRFVRWAQRNLANFDVVSPGNGIIHQINLESLARVVRLEAEDLLVPDTLVGTDSHTPMVGAMGVLAWGVGGLEGQAAALGEPLDMQLPPVVGIHTTGRLQPGVGATDLVLHVTEMLRKLGVVGQFVEFFGSGLDHLSLADRATIANMAPEYGATTTFFPIDAATLAFLAVTGRDAGHISLVEAYAKAQGLWRDPAAELAFPRTVELDLGTVETSLSGPTRPHQRVNLAAVPASFAEALGHMPRQTGGIEDGAVLIASITSCTNTANPRLILQAGLLARAAHARGLTPAPWVRTSLSPGSRAVAGYLETSGLGADLDALGFAIAGYGCMTCIGNSGPLAPEIVEAVGQGLAGTAVISGNRNFEGRINPHIRLAYLASPALVVAYALAGTVTRDLRREPIGFDRQGQPVMLADIWPADADIDEVLATAVAPAYARHRQAGLVEAPAWTATEAKPGVTWAWEEGSTYIRRPPYFDRSYFDQPAPASRVIAGARMLMLLGDHVTTDHISPAGAIPRDSLAARYLRERGVADADFNQYSTRRSNHEVMMRGLFTNPTLVNALLPEAERQPGGRTMHLPSGRIMTAFEAAERYRREGTPLIVVGGTEYGAGSSRDWGAKGPALLGVRAVIAGSFERIHRSNLVGMGVMPLAFEPGTSAGTLGLTGTELFDLVPVADHPRRMLLTIRRPGSDQQGGSRQDVPLRLCVETRTEEAYLDAGGILPHVLDHIASH
ncbi:MAG TPA: aconitate hydratase AcnA [Stellaceae bacterium]|nr:aconitate hydratase AcnA [Stellaceae bacterium]